MSDERPGQTDGVPADQNRALGQQRDEPGPGPDQTAPPPSAGGRGTGAGSSVEAPSEDQRAETPAGPKADPDHR